MTIKITSNNPILKNKEILSFEKKYKINLPDEYKTFISKYNGGEPSLRTFFDFKGNEYDLLFFNSLEEIEDFIEIYFDLIPEDMLPIGVIDGNSWVFISIKKSNNGMIFLGDSNTCRGIQESELNYISNSFNSFLNILC